MPIKISVVIPTYCRPLLLEKCLAALANQTVAQSFYEVLVVSDGKDKSTEEVVKKFTNLSEHVYYLYLPQKKGPAATRNHGWKNASAEIIAFTDDDTIPDKDWLAGYLNAYKGENMIAFTGKVKVPISPTPTDYEKNTAGLETAEFVTANCCCTKKALEKTGGFDERFSMAWREDSDLEFSLLSHRIPIVHVPQALIVHPVRQAPWGISIKEQKKGMFNALLYKKFPSLYRQKIQSRPMWNYYIINISFMLFLAGLVIQSKWLFIIPFCCWLFLVTDFIIKRLKYTSKAATHILEMIFTSIAIPFLSVYWQLYGAMKYRVLFL
jgi:glycosyltransferase involved in cell wall biosynthesis